jgi:hypothetical protein
VEGAKRGLPAPVQAIGHGSNGSAYATTRNKVILKITGDHHEFLTYWRLRYQPAALDSEERYLLAPCYGAVLLYPGDQEFVGALWKARCAPAPAPPKAPGLHDQWYTNGGVLGRRFRWFDCWAASVQAEAQTHKHTGIGLPPSHPSPSLRAEPGAIRRGRRSPAAMPRTLVPMRCA